MTYHRTHVGRSHPLADSRGRVLAHRLAWDCAGNPPLQPHEVLHHADFDPSNNAIENLVVMDRRAHSKLHAEHRRMARLRRRWAGWLSEGGEVRFCEERRREVLRE